MISSTVDSDGICTVTWDLADRPVNVLSMASRLAFVAAIEAAIADPGVKGILVTSAKKEFIAGADLTLLQGFRGAPAAEITTKMSALRDLLRKMETAGKPVVAAMNGTALGGGLEICLACHRRIAADRDDALFGLPEVGLGLLPGAGGTQRLTRMVGIRAALPLLLEGTKLSARQAMTAGFIDQVVPADQLLATARAWLLSGPDATQPWDRPGWTLPGGAATSPENHRLFMAQAARIQAETRDNLPAPPAILSCVYEGLRVPIDVGLAIEFRHLAELVRGDVAQNTIRTMFFSQNDLRKLGARPKDVAPFALTRLGVLGAGTMGAGLAQIAAQAGLEVVLLDRSADDAHKGMERIAKTLGREVDKGRLTAAARDAQLERIRPTADYADLAGCQAVVEAVFEDRAIKDDVTTRTLAVTGPDILFASNTSKIPISGLAQSSPRPDRFIGMHFFSPVPRMALLEIIKGDKTSDQTLAQALDLAKCLGKTPIVVNDGPGFFTSRCVSTYLNEGIAMLREGVAPALIENCGRHAGMPVGPLSLADEIGIDVMYKVRAQEGQDRGFTGAEFPVVEKLYADLGRHGRKNGGGFYDYPADGGQKVLWPGLHELFAAAPDQPDPALLRRRLLHVQALEAARCFGEGIIDDPRQADVGSILGWGFARHTGGVCSYIDTIGAQAFVAQCRDMASRFGDRYQPPAFLVALAERGAGFYAPTGDAP